MNDAMLILETGNAILSRARNMLSSTSMEEIRQLKDTCIETASSARSFVNEYARKIREMENKKREINKTIRALETDKEQLTTDQDALRGEKEQWEHMESDLKESARSLNGAYWALKNEQPYQKPSTSPQ